MRLPESSSSLRTFLRALRQRLTAWRRRLFHPQAEMEHSSRPVLLMSSRSRGKLRATSPNVNDETTTDGPSVRTDTTSSTMDAEDDEQKICEDKRSKQAPFVPDKLAMPFLDRSEVDYIFPFNDDTHGYNMTCTNFFKKGDPASVPSWWVSQEIDYIKRNGDPTGGEHVRQWARFFPGNGAQERWIRIEGQLRHLSCTAMAGNSSGTRYGTCDSCDHPQGWHWKGTAEHKAELQAEVDTTIDTTEDIASPFSPEKKQ